jgi:hypothetical protein
MVAHIKEADVLAGARDRRDGLGLAARIAGEQRRDVDHRDLGEIENAGRRHDHARSPGSGSGGKG